MILVGRYGSPYGRRIAVTRRLTGIPYERRTIAAWDDFDAVTSVNPVGRVPALILDDGEVIVESILQGRSSRPASSRNAPVSWALPFIRIHFS